MSQQGPMDKREKCQFSWILEEEKEANKRQWVKQTIQIQTMVTLATGNLQ